MTALHQFVHTLNYGDAISDEALLIRRILQEKGLESEIYSVHAHPKVSKETKSYLDYSPHESSRLLLHYSIASPLNDLFISSSVAERILLYHNVTPVHWYRSYNARVAEDLVQARAELERVAGRSDRILADSNFNLSELAKLGVKSGSVLPLALDPHRWDAPANRGIGVSLAHGGVCNVLHVGRLAPNKCLEDIIKAFYFYHHKIEPKSKLWLVGSDVDNEVYSFELRRLVSELRLKHAVTFAGGVSTEELKAFYQNASLYMCMSEHEGFCLPLLEAMHFSLPVIAFDACAIGETLGLAGVLLPNKDAALTSEMMHLVLSDDALRSKLKRLGQERVQEYSREAFIDALDEVLLRPAQGEAGPMAVGAGG